MNWIEEQMNAIYEQFAHTVGGKPVWDQPDEAERVFEFVRTALQEAHTKGTQEALAKVEEWLEKTYGDGINNPALVIIEPTESGVSQRPALPALLHHLQQLKDNKTQ